MFGSEILEIAIGLILIYLLMSLIMTAVQETIAGLLKTRARNLDAALLQLLQNDRSLVRALYEHPLVSGLYKGTLNGANRPPKSPSYIPRETFAAALLDLRNIDTFDAIGKDALDKLGKIENMLGRLAGTTDLAAQKKLVEQWYDGAMDRASGWYKRNTQKWLFGLALSGSIVLNVNSIVIAQYLAVNPEQRALVGKLADRFVAEAPRPEQVQEGTGGSAAPAVPGTQEAAPPAVAPDTPDTSGDPAASAAPQDAPVGADEVRTDPAAPTGEDEGAGGNALGNDQATEQAETRSGDDICLNADPPSSPAADSDNGAANGAASTTGIDNEQANGSAGGARGDGGAEAGDSAETPMECWSREQLRQFTDGLREIGLPIGWQDASVAWLRRGFPGKSFAPDSTNAWGAWLLLLAGYLITALAVMLGAPFWFDVLNKFMVIRNTVKPKEKSPDEPPVDGPDPRRLNRAARR